jgi:hypothetical protein
MILAVAKLHQDGPVPADRGAVQAHTPGVQVIHPQQVRAQLLLERLPVRISAQVPQHIGQSISTHIAYLTAGIATAAQRLQATLCPRLHLIHAMVGLRKQIRQPDECHPAQTQSLAVAVRGEMRVQQGDQPHPLHVGQQQWDVIYPLGGNGKGLAYVTSLLESSFFVQIYANRENEGTIS